MKLEQVVVGGVYLPPFLVFVAASAVVYLLLRLLLRRFSAHRLFWHPALAEAGLFVLILAVIMLLFGP